MHAFESHRQWNAVKEAYSKLKTAGFQALLAGGCVRDLIMGRTPNDFDIATNATPDQVAAIFPKALLVGREFGVTIIPVEDYKIEIATFRVDGSYKDGRRPDSVTFSTPEEDAKRRDFTVNALFYDLDQKKVVDYVGGEADIKAKLIRAVGEPEKRFSEDKLRLLRAVRFAAQLGFEIEPSTFSAISKLYAAVNVVAQERIRDEFVKLFKAKAAERGLELLLHSKLALSIFPEFKEIWSSSDVIEKTKSHLKGGTDSSEVGFLKLFYEAAQRTGADTVRETLKRLKSSNNEAEAVLWALRNRSLMLESQSVREATLIRALANPNAEIAARFYDAEIGAFGVDQKTHAAAKVLRQKIESTILQGSRTLPERLITGDDLQKLGFQKGRTLGDVLDEAFNLQLEGKLTSRDQALAWAKTKN